MEGKISFCQEDTKYHLFTIKYGKFLEEKTKTEMTKAWSKF